MTEQDRHLESERLIDEAMREIEAIREALEANREFARVGPGKMTGTSQEKPAARTN